MIAYERKIFFTFLVMCLGCDQTTITKNRNIANKDIVVIQNKVDKVQEELSLVNKSEKIINTEPEYEIPTIIANKEWVLFFEQEVEYPPQNIFTKKTTIEFDFIEPRTLFIDSVKSVYDGYVLYQNTIGTHLKFIWLDKQKHIAMWVLMSEGETEYVTYYSYEKGYPSNRAYLIGFLPTKKKSKHSVIIDNRNFLNETIKDMEGVYDCDGDYKQPMGKTIIDETGDSIIVKLSDELSVVACSRQYKTDENKFGLFLIGIYESRIDFELDNYVLDKPFAELEVLDATIIRKTWFGFYNKKKNVYETNWATLWDVCDIIDCS